MREARRSLSKQIFQLAYHGKISAEFTSSLEISERNYFYELLKEQLEKEQKEHEKEAAKVKAQSSKIKSSTSGMRRGRR
jgi:hypothetical protein